MAEGGSNPILRLLVFSVSYRNRNLSYLGLDQRVFGTDTRFPVLVKGYFLTERGRIAYCDWADKHMPSRSQL